MRRSRVAELLVPNLVDLQLAAGTIERQLKGCNRKARTNYHL